MSPILFAISRKLQCQSDRIFSAAVELKYFYLIIIKCYKNKTGGRRSPWASKEDATTWKWSRSNTRKVNERKPEARREGKGPAKRELSLMIINLNSFFLFSYYHTNSHKNGIRGLTCFANIKSKRNLDKHVHLKGERGGRSIRKENATIRARANANSNKPWSIDSQPRGKGKSTPECEWQCVSVL